MLYRPGGLTDQTWEMVILAMGQAEAVARKQYQDWYQIKHYQLAELARKRISTRRLLIPSRKTIDQYLKGQLLREDLN